MARRLPLFDKDRVYKVSFDPTGTRVVTASADGSAGIWDVATGAQLHTFKHSRGVLDASFDPSAAVVATASEDGTAAVWRVDSGERLFGFSHEATVNGIAFN